MITMQTDKETRRDNFGRYFRFVRLELLADWILHQSIRDTVRHSMKKCPNCGRLFDGDNDYCLDDGSRLINAGAIVSPPAPTVAMPSVPTVAGGRRESTGRMIYFIVGAMGLVIASLSIVILALTLRTSAPSAKNANNRASNRESAPPAPAANSAVVLPKTEPLDEDSVRGVLVRWEKAQDERNFAAYRSCYAPQFVGIKRTKGGRETRMDYSVWMNDRQKMFRNLIDVSADDPQITLEGDSATVLFIQRFRSVNYEDTGQKTLRLKMLPEGARIVFEELKYAY